MTPRPLRLLAAAAALGALLAAPSAAIAQAAPPPASPAAPEPPLVNQRQPRPEVLTGGVPKSLDRLSELAAAGFRTVVDLRGDTEVTAETSEAVAGAGMLYERLPVTGEADLDLAKARALHALLHDPGRQPMAVVCSSGNRSGALLALEAFWLHGTPAAQALELGQAAGMTRLEASVRLLLGLPPAPPAETPPAAASTPPTSPP